MNLRLFALLSAAPLALGSCSREPVPPMAPLPPPATIPQPPETRLTYEHYMQIKAGMTEQQVRDLFGKPTTIEAEEVQKDARVFYTYDNGWGSTLRVGFQNGKVVSKSCNLDERKALKKP